MFRYLIRRLLQSVLMLFLMSIAFFTLLHLMPGGPAQAIGANNPRITFQARQAIAHRYGLDQPVPLQYLQWLWNALHLDFGNSFETSRPVITEIAFRLPNTLELLLTSFALALAVALVLGILAAVKQYSLTDYTITVLSYAGISMPVFWFGLILQEIFGVALHWLPVYGISSPDTTGFSQTDLIIDRLTHLILPAIMLAMLSIAVWSRYLRSSMLDVVKQDYIRTAKAKGLSSRAVFVRHALRNALIPLVTVVALSFGGIVGGAVITEQVFAWPGMGSLFFFALGLPDYPILMGFLILSTASVIFFNLVADILYAVIDPRIRYS